MAEFTLMIAEAGEELGLALQQRLAPLCQVTLCRDSRQVLQALQEPGPDILVLNLMLPGMDGISLLETILSSGRRPEILALSSYVSPCILEKAQKLGVGCLMQLPCSLEMLARKVEDRLRALPQAGREDLRGKISGILLALGFSSKRRGYVYLREAVYDMVIDPDRAMVKELYASVGAAFGVTARLVEHSVRGAILDAWEGRCPETWNLYLGDRPPVRPTTAALIQSLAGYLRACGQWDVLFKAKEN